MVPKFASTTAAAQLALRGRIRANLDGTVGFVGVNNTGDVMKNSFGQIAVAIGTLGLTVTAMPARAVDADAAQALAKSSECMVCHAVDKKKLGPAFKEVAAKYKGKAGAEDQLYKHLTTGPMVDMGGSKVAHKIVKSKDEAQIRNLVKWILAQ
jgi:cytochrome c